MAERNAIGIIELTSIAAGYAVTDAMLKAGTVEVLVARTICSGKYLSIIGGNVSDTKEALDAGVLRAEGTLVDTCLLTNIHPAVFPAITGSNTPTTLDALGVLESFSVAALLEAADAAVKAAAVDLIEIRLAMALGGKAFCTLTGDVASVESAVRVGSERIASKGLLVNRTVIPRPRPELLNEII
ncbi:BMC domain-containing protein [Candidatus Poribacteria bacterium]|nr:BMC domain-containing protein [Candidatus Poribacteria bacterium]